MARVMFILTAVIIGLVIAGNITMLGLFALTSVGLTPAEEAMLTMTSAQINAMYGQSVAILNQLSMYQNFTDKLIDLTLNLRSIESQQASLNTSAYVLEESAEQLEMDLLAYNQTIGPQMEIIQEKLDNVTLPVSLNLSLAVNTTMLSNGTVTWLNPNNPVENVTLGYEVREQLGSQYIKMGPGALNYVTTGASAWSQLSNWMPALIFNAPSTRGQILDDQRLKLNAFSRIYTVGDIQLPFDGTAQLLNMAELDFNVGLI